MPNAIRQLPYRGMPNAITIKQLPSVYLANNYKGFDIYESRVDKMRVLVPDSMNAASIPLTNPNDGNQYIQMPRDVFNDLLEKQKATDSLFIKPQQPKTFRYPRK